MTKLHFIFWICAFWLVACDSSQNKNAFTDIQIVERGFQSGGEFCKDFTMQEKEIEQFFIKANVKTPREIHDEFEYLPCYIRGTSTHQQQTVSWEIRAGGTARVIYPDDSQIEFGCTDCF